MAPTTRAMTSIFAVVLATLSLALLLTRGGLLAGLGLAFGLAMLAKVGWRPGDADLRWTVGGVAVWAALWGIALGSAYFGWERGEVVVLRPVEPTTGASFDLRVWVVDDEVTGTPVVFYDGSRDRLAAIGNQATLEWVRQGVTRRSQPTLYWMDDASPEFVTRITDLYEKKYGNLNWATNVFFLFAGRAPGRTIGILELGPLDAQ